MRGQPPWHWHIFCTAAETCRCCHCRIEHLRTAIHARKGILRWMTRREPGATSAITPDNSLFLCRLRRGRARRHRHPGRVHRAVVVGGGRRGRRAEPHPRRICADHPRRHRGAHHRSAGPRGAIRVRQQRFAALAGAAASPRMGTRRPDTLVVLSARSHSSTRQCCDMFTQPVMQPRRGRANETRALAGDCWTESYHCHVHTTMPCAA